MRQDAAANSAHEDEVSRARSADQGEGEGGEDGEGKGKSTTVSRILQQISSRLVTLMHEVVLFQLNIFVSNSNKKNKDDNIHNRSLTLVECQN